MSERVVTVGGNKATRPIADFSVSLATEYFVGPNATGAGDDGRSGKSKETSLATLEAAIALAVAQTSDKNDIIYLLPGHTETISTAGAIALDKIGLRVINLGVGAYAATFTFSTVDATITMTAASCSIEGFPIFKPSIDSVVSPLVISAADCKADIYIQDKDATVECVNGVLTTAAADRLDLNVKYRGFIAGGACVNAVRLVGVDTARINVDFYGVASTAIVEFHTTACHDIDISGKFYNDGTSLTKNVLDTVTGSTWSCQGWDGNSNANFSGGDNAALASDDITALATAIGVLDEFHDVPAANNTLNTQINEVVGNKTDTTAAGAVTATDTLVAYIKQLVAGGIARDTALGVVDDLHDVPIADAVTNLYMRDVVGIKTDAAAAGAVSSVESLMAYVKQAITLAIARDTAIGVVDGLHDVPTADATPNLYIRDVVGIKTDAAINAVATTKTLMAYLKGVLNEITVPAQNNTDNAFINDVIGQKTDAAAAGAVTTDDTLTGYIKQLVTAAIADAAQTLKLDGVTIATDPVAASLASFIASGGTSLGTQLPAGFSLLDMGRGKQVSRTAADVFDGSQTPLFTVSGGRVLVKALVGEVSVAAIDAGASNTSFVTNPTVGTDAAMCAVLDINADENGTIYALSGNPANALTGGSGGGASCMDRCFIVPEGTIDLLSAADVGTGGALGAFDIWYIPLDTGATIVSA